MLALKCPMCGAHIEYDETGGHVECRFCNTRFVAKELLAKQAQQPAGTGTAMLDRAYLLLEAGDFIKADALLEAYLNTVDAHSAKAYVGKLMAQRQVRQEAALAGCDTLLSQSGNYTTALRFADAALTERLKDYERAIAERLAEAQKRREEEKAQREHNLFQLAVFAGLIILVIFIAVVVADLRAGGAARFESSAVGSSNWPVQEDWGRFRITTNEDGIQETYEDYNYS